MDNKSIAKVFKLYGQLMELHNSNPFRTKAIASSAFKIDKLPFSAYEATVEQLTDTPGIGASTAEKIKTIITSGTLPELDALVAKTPVGIQEMLLIKGLGPKKIQIIWNTLNIETVGELYYACNENRLIEAKGFGLKTQEEIKKNIEFSMANEGWILYAKARRYAEDMQQLLQQHFPSNRIEFSGEYRRKCEVLQQVDMMVDIAVSELSDFLQKQPKLSDLNQKENTFYFKTEQHIAFSLHTTSTTSFALNQIITTGSQQHIDQLMQIASPLPDLSSEEEIYQSLGMQYIAPELREGTNEIVLAQQNRLPDLISYGDLKGSLHNHSTYSDGVHSLREMAQYCKDHLHLEYLGICDHSKTAVYANGLSIETVQRQWAEIDQLNQELAPFKIFKGIESDILGDGSLDYRDEILAGFDFVVASIHSNLKMDEARATERLIKAIENPYTTILGHPTGRLLLSRAGYPIDYKKVIDACAEHHVVIEINANPLRLDLDWRWHQYALEKGVLLSVNPDAHRVEGFHDMEYGVYVARKGGVTKDICLNAFSLAQIEDYFRKR